jgi:type I restriction enzyme S subunit
MSTGLKPYPVMKDSGIEWLGEVPEHWEVKRGKSLFQCIDIRSKTGEEELLTVSSRRGVVPRKSANVTMFKAESYIGHKLCWPNDLVINSLWAWAGGLGVSNHHGIISTAYSVYRPSSCVEPRFIHELVRSIPFHWELLVRSKGVWTSRLQLTDDSFLDAPFVLPPPPEQATIVRYLDYMDRRVRKLVQTKRKLIALLTEQKQAIIHRVITRGIDPDVPLKDSCSEWLGEVPAHWEPLKLGRIISDGPKNGISPPIDEEGTIESFSISAIRDGRVDVLDKDKKYIVGNQPELETSYCLMAGDILLVRGNGNIHLVGKTGLVEFDMPGRVYPDLLMRIRLTQRCLPRYFVLLMGCSIARNQIETAARTTVGSFKINNQQVRQFRFAFPPVSEQQDIISYLGEELSTIDVALSRTEDEIRLLTEYRTRLVADVVTGKLDVRKAAAALPDVDLLTTEDDPDALALKDDVDDHRDTETLEGPI